MKYDPIGYVKRSEFYLRSKYPEIKTKIFKINEHFCCIYCSNIDDRFEEISKEFGYKIRPVTTPVNLTNVIPKNYIEEIPLIQDDEISQNYEGLSMRTIDMLNLLTGKFPQIDILNIIGNEGDQKIKIHIKEKLSDTEEKEFKDFLDKLKQGIEIVIINNSEIERHQLFENPALYIYSTRLSKKKYKFIERDEALWYDNLDSFYNGSFKKEELYFINNKNSNCYADYSLSDNLNIRNHILLYDNIFLSLPVEKPIKCFLENQKVKHKELLEVISQKRIKTLLTQPENRYDIGFLNEVYDIAPDAVVSRRALNAAILLDLIELNKNYFIVDLNLDSVIYDLAKMFAYQKKENVNEIYNFLSWPIRAFRESFSYFENGSPYKIGAFGVNNTIQEVISKRINKDITLEFIFAATNVHIASSINGAYYPCGEISGYSDRHYANILSQLLSFYKNSTTSNAIAYNKYKNELNKVQKLVAPISAFEINEYIPIDEFNEICNICNCSDTSIRLLNFLNNLDDKDRANKIKEYNLEINKMIKKRGKISKSFDFTYSVALDIAGLWVPFLGAGIKGIEMLAKKTGLPQSAKKKIMNGVETLLYKNNEEKIYISFLSKINPIARLKDI